MRNPVSIDPLMAANLAVELGIDALPEAEKQEILQRIGSIVFQRAMRQVVEILPEPKQKELEAAIDESAKNPQVLMTFLQTNVPQLDAIVTSEIHKWREESSAVMGVGK